VSYTDSGALLFSGYDSAAFGEPGYGYEYDIAVEADQFAALRRALRVDADADVLDAVCAHVGEIMPGGERSWLDSRGIAHSLSTWHHPPD
jgi:hypothetical protein